MPSLKYLILLLLLIALPAHAQRMPEIVALINSSIEEGQRFQCDDSGWVIYEKVNYVGSDYRSLLFFEFDLEDVHLMYSHDQYVFLENHEEHWIYVSHRYTDNALPLGFVKSREKDILASAGITIDLRPGVDSKSIIEALKLLQQEEP